MYGTGLRGTRLLWIGVCFFISNVYCTWILQGQGKGNKKFILGNILPGCSCFHHQSIMMSYKVIHDTYGCFNMILCNFSISHQWCDGFGQFLADHLGELNPSIIHCHSSCDCWFQGSEPTLLMLSPGLGGREIKDKFKDIFLNERFRFLDTDHWVPLSHQ